MHKGMGAARRGVMAGTAALAMILAATGSAEARRPPHGPPSVDPQSVAIARLRCTVAGMSYTTISINASNPTEIDIAAGATLRWRLLASDGSAAQTGSYTLPTPLRGHLAVQLAVIPRVDAQGCEIYTGPVLTRPQLDPRIIDRGPIVRPGPVGGPLRGGGVRR